jgi:hypothetical protein
MSRYLSCAVIVRVGFLSPLVIAVPIEADDRLYGAFTLADILRCLTWHFLLSIHEASDVLAKAGIFVRTVMSQRNCSVTKDGNGTLLLVLL